MNKGPSIGLFTKQQVRIAIRIYREDGSFIVILIHCCGGPLPGTPITVKASAPVDPRSARSGISARQGQEQYRVEVTLADSDKTIQISTKSLSVGKYDLVINELLEAKGERFPKLIVIPFILDKLAGQVPDGARVENVTRLQIGEHHSRKLRPGQDAEKDTGYVEFVKVVDPKSHAPTELAFDHQGQRIDGNDKINGLRQRRLAKFGRLHENLHNHLQNKSDKDTVDVVVWPHLDKALTSHDKPTDRPVDAPPTGEREADKEVAKRRDNVTKVLQDLGAKVQNSRTNSPAVHASLTVAQAQKLKQSDSVGVALLDNSRGIPDLTNSQAIGRANQAQNLGFTGTGVKVAVFEDGPSDLTNLSFAGRYQTSPNASNHARLTNAIIKNTEPSKPHGYAPNCSLYSANSYDNQALQWALDQGCTVISQSFHRDTENNSATIQPDDISKDWMVLRYPYPTIVQAAGNIDGGAATEYVNHKG